jgi:molybdopterin converting factor small subunit
VPNKKKFQIDCRDADGPFVLRLSTIENIAVIYALPCHDCEHIICSWNKEEDAAGTAKIMGARWMAKIVFTANIQRHVICPETEAAGGSVREVLDNVFAANPQARSYVLDDQASLRKHMTIFVDGKAIRDRARLSDAVAAGSTIYVFQALSGG